ncbi:MAG: site-specific DNA-methyltransferase, partial [Methanobacterium paludis]|nr:site-specific DNA-methyltransferase [Methanobacterium paludis]
SASDGTSATIFPLCSRRRIDRVVFKKTIRGPLLNADGNQAHWNIYIKKYLGAGVWAPSTLLPREQVGSYNQGTQTLQKLFGGRRFFNNAKPVNLIRYFVRMVTKKGDTVLDFFSGSATTAQAVMQLNAEDSQERRFIMVQLEEPTDPRSTAYRFGYFDICAIGEERIRRAGNQILEALDSQFKRSGEPQQNMNKPDIGFKVFHLDYTDKNAAAPDPDNG